MPDVSSLVPRDSSSKLSKSTIIIIAVVAASVVALIFVLFAWRFLTRPFRRSTVPLPPPQDLAHHREQQLSSFADRSPRPTTWLDPLAYHQKPYSSRFLSASGSSTSLIRSSPDMSVSRGPTRENSWTAESLENSPIPTTDDLMPPHPAFLPLSKTPHTSMASVVSTSSDGISDINASPGFLPASPSDVSHSVESSTSVAVTPGRSRPPRGSRSRQRPTSIVSSSGTMHSLQTAHSGNTLRGPAHSIHSNIQIVLPTPLAPQIYLSQDAMERSSSFYGVNGDRRSMADPWVAIGSRSQSSISAFPTCSASHSNTGLRPPYQRSRSNLSVSSGRVRRAQSQSALNARDDPRAPIPSMGHTRSSSVPKSVEMLPPLPMVPPLPSMPSMSMFKSGSTDTVAYPTPPGSVKDQATRGRPREPARTSRAAASDATVAPPSAFSMPMSISGSSNKLRKARSQSRIGAAS